MISVDFGANLRLVWVVLYSRIYCI